MYRDNAVYDELDTVALELLVDYNIVSFPIDIYELCHKLGIILNPYSKFSEEEQMLLYRKTPHGFLVPPTYDYPAEIYYNDIESSANPVGSIRQTIFHEIKHFVFGEYFDELPEDDDLAEHFGRFLSCPTPYVIVKKLYDPDVIMETFNTSFSIANNVISNAKNRVATYGDQIFEYEQKFIDLVENEERRRSNWMS